MSNSEFPYMSAVELSALIRSRRASPVDVAAQVIDRIARLNPAVNAFAWFDPERVLDDARAAERQMTGSQNLGPIHGVPVTMKEYVAIRGTPARLGSRITSDQLANADSPLVSRLKAAGAIILGKTTISEYGWTAISKSPLTGDTHNPWKHGYNAGASSAGAAVAAAAGFGPLHHGSDGAGSIRLPAHFSGVYGLKPTFGRVPNGPVNLNDNTSHAGPITRTVADAALMLGVMAGPHFSDHTCLETWLSPTPPLLAPMSHKRVAFSLDLGHAQVESEVADIVQKAATRFANVSGCEISEVTPPWGKKGRDIAYKLWAAHLSQLNDELPAKEHLMDPALVQTIRAGDITMREYQRLRAAKYSYVAEIHAFFEEWDLLLTPTASVAAFPLAESERSGLAVQDLDWFEWAQFSYPFNLSGNPAASIPCGMTSDGRPVGLQIVGRRFEDIAVLQASATFERDSPWAGLRPNIAPIQETGLG